MRDIWKPVLDPKGDVKLIQSVHSDHLYFIFTCFVETLSFYHFALVWVALYLMVKMNSFVRAEVL